MREGNASDIVTGSGAAGDPTSVTSGSATPPPCSTRRSTASWAAAAGQGRVDTALEAARGLGGQLVPPRGPGDRHRVEVRRLDEDVARRAADLGLGAAHDAGDGDGALAAAVGDEQVAGVEGAVGVVERGDPLAGAGPPHDDRRLEGGEVEGVQRLAEAEHDVVRDVDRQRDRAHARLGEPRRHPRGGWVPRRRCRGRRGRRSGRSRDGRGSGPRRRARPRTRRRWARAPSAARSSAGSVNAAPVACEYSRATPRTEKQYPRSGVTLTSTVSRSSPSSGRASAPGTSDASSSASPANFRVSTRMPSWSSPMPSSRSEQIIPAETWP